jgi:hypothetical protein
VLRAQGVTRFIAIGDLLDRPLAVNGARKRRRRAAIDRVVSAWVVVEISAGQND